MPDDIAIFQVLAGGLIRRTVNQSELFGPLQQSDFFNRLIISDQPAGIGKIDVYTLFLLRLQDSDISVAGA